MFYKLIKRYGYGILAIVIFSIGVFFSLSSFDVKGLFSGSLLSQPNSLARVLSDTCQPGKLPPSSNKETCYSAQFRLVAEKYGPAYSFQVLSSLQDIDPLAKGCHFISHGIGYGSYKKDPTKWRELIQVIDSTCGYGAIHGVIEQYISTLPSQKLSGSDLDTICGDKPRADCNHILGHLLLVETNADIPKALEICEEFKDLTQLFHCRSGVFMEDITAQNLIDHKIADQTRLNWTDRLPELKKLCLSQSDDLAVPCWTEITHAALVAFNYDADKFLKFCDQSQIQEGSKRCKRHGLGIIAGAKSLEIDGLKTVCQLPQKNDELFERDCYTAFAAIKVVSLPGKADEVIRFCVSLAPIFHDSCLAQVGINLKDSAGFSKAKLEVLCQSLESNDQKSCLRVDNNQDSGAHLLRDQ